MKPPSFDELDSEAARRALDFYLNPTTSQRPVTDEPLVVAREDLNADEAITHAAALLRSVAATVFEAAEHQRGTVRDSLYTVMHLMNMARALLDRYIIEQEKADTQ
ncbi:hypothetical protein DCO48_13800 [Pseudomonas sp. SDI]|uniref:DUF6124 family protein n=1 Tax=Pseudomonas sp. SDI TaxID=2170734 RepID=UPI000DE6A5FB|nr:DUF3077 domain-containing protein [Pseudomonas sp. SDI]PWB32407.1 hypothetical protein DCO48_13800 [Pseudomonas sp. SDI]